MSGHYDVVIAGGGFAGLTLARQLCLQLPDLSILVVEEVRRPLPIAAHKVGESIGTVPTWWLREVLGLKSEVDQHVPKHGLHFIGIRGDGPLEERIEYAVRARPLTGLPAYQLDRGRFENYLREANDELGVTMVEGCLVNKISLAEDGGFHTVKYIDKGTRQEFKVSCRFVVDATGRKRYLARKLGLARAVKHPANATWWRVGKPLDISDIVPEKDTEWHERVETRRDTTLHVFGKGYWMWFIPLPNGYTSVGIVGGERLHPISERNTHESSLAWLEKHEPEIANWLRDIEPIDFLAYRRLAHTTKEAFSAEGWFSIGEAAAFTDPFFSNGADLIAWADIIVTHLIKLKLEGRLTDTIVDQYNELFLGWVGMITDKFRSMYEVLGDDLLMLAKPLWDSGQYWAGPAQMLFQGFLEHEEILPEYLALARRFISLNQQVQGLFVKWAELRTEKKLPAGFYDPTRAFPRIREVARGGVREKSQREFLEEMAGSLRLFEDYARVFFRMAIRDVMPEAEESLPAPLWINPYAVGLDPDTWEEDGLFSPEDEPRPHDLELLSADMTLLDEPIRPSRPNGETNVAIAT